MSLTGGCGGQHVIGGGHDTAVATAAADTTRTFDFSLLFSGSCDVRTALALAMLCLVPMGCLNLDHIGRPIEGENHVPVVDVLPAPTLTPISAAVSLDGSDACAATELNFVRLDDDDGDTLSVQWHMIFISNNREVRQLLKSSPPIQPLDDGSYATNDSTDLTLDADLLERRLTANLPQQLGAGPEVFQLIELRVSDNLIVDGDPEPQIQPGAGLVYRTWNVKLVPCVGGPV